MPFPPPPRGGRGVPGWGGLRPPSPQCWGLAHLSGAVVRFGSSPVRFFSFFLCEFSTCIWRVPFSVHWAAWGHPPGPPFCCVRARLRAECASAPGGPGFRLFDLCRPLFLSSRSCCFGSTLWPCCPLLIFLRAPPTFWALNILRSWPSACADALPSGCPMAPPGALCLDFGPAFAVTGGSGAGPAAAPTLPPAPPAVSLALAAPSPRPGHVNFPGSICTNALCISSLNFHFSSYSAPLYLFSRRLSRRGLFTALASPSLLLPSV